MEKLKQKLSSRKLWAAIIAVIVVLAVSLLGEELTPEIVSALECASNLQSSAVHIFTSTSLDTVAPSFFIFASVAGLIPAFAASSLLFISRSMSSLKSFL